MRKQLFFAAIFGLSMMACSSPKFTDNSAGNAFGKTAGSEMTSSELGTAEGRIPGENDDDDGFGSIPLADFLALVETDPRQAAEIADQDECCISHGNGHGIELCMTGDKTAIANLSPIEIKGNAICVPQSVVEKNAALFTGAALGRCAK